jgi:hypothetical protein
MTCHGSKELHQVSRVIFIVEDTFPRRLFTLELLACDRVRQKRYLEGVPASISRHDNIIESRMRTDCRDN